MYIKLTYRHTHISTNAFHKNTPFISTKFYYIYVHVLIYIYKFFYMYTIAHTYTYYKLFTLLNIKPYVYIIFY